MPQNHRFAQDIGRPAVYVVQDMIAGAAQMSMAAALLDRPTCYSHAIMSLITRYLLRHLVAVTLFVTLALTLVVWLTQSLKLLELIAASDAPPAMFLKLVLLTLPRFLEIILPLALVTGVLFIYHKMIMDNELIVMRACGFDHFALAKPALLLGLTFTIICFALTSYVSPRGYAEMQQMRQHLKSEYTAFLLRDGVFNTFGRNLTVYVRQRSAEGDLLGLMIHDARDSDKPPVTITAKRGRLVTDGEAPQIIVYDGMRQQIDARNSDSLTKLYFSRYTIEIKGFADQRPARWREASERTLIELFNPDTSNRADRLAADEFTAAAHHRIASPFNALSYTVVALACLMLGSFNRRGQTRKIITAALIVVVLQTLNLALLSAAKDHLSLIPLLYLVTFGPLFGGLFVMTLRGEQFFKHLLASWRNRSVHNTPAVEGGA